MALSNRITRDQIVTLVRTIMRDSPSHNELTEGFNMSDDEILVALAMAVDDWNTTPPPVKPMDMAKERFYAPNWLIDMTVIKCFEMIVNQNIANQLAYNDGGISIDRWNKAPMYQAVIDRNLPRLEQKKQNLKLSMNHALFAGSVLSSEFTVWTYSALYPGMSSQSAISMASSPYSQPRAEPKPAVPTVKQFTVHIGPRDFILSKDAYIVAVTHGLGRNVDVKITDQNGRADIRRHFDITFLTDDTLTLSVPAHPDGRRDAIVTVYVIG